MKGIIYMKKVLKDLEYYRNTNEEKGVVYIPSYIIDRNIERIKEFISKENNNYTIKK